MIKLIYTAGILAIAFDSMPKIPINSRMLVLEAYFLLINLGYQFVVFE